MTLENYAADETHETHACSVAPAMRLWQLDVVKNGARQAAERLFSLLFLKKNLIRVLLFSYGYFDRRDVCVTGLGAKTLGRGLYFFRRDV